ncbi:MAG TPA: acetyl-CoA carboxylase biotin carboxyl carrier protein [Polyangia bacterium]|jgi:acetyl-CoA carboxylase biotin carboxyl carrier protein|nr:acetyl-CoA carboxylase biotin carboxyl carrier protein [Polyangia bacterium]
MSNRKESKAKAASKPPGRPAAGASPSPSSKPVGGGINLDVVRELARIAGEFNLSEVEADPSGHVRVRRRFAAKLTERKTSSAVPALSLAPPPPSEGANEPGMVITSPFVGTFYRAPSPDAAAFAEVGDTVRKGQVVCIVEAMKLMNEIEAEADGRVAEILVQNGAHVEYGQAMIRLSKG